MKELAQKHHEEEIENHEDSIEELEVCYPPQPHTQAYGYLIFQIVLTI